MNTNDALIVTFRLAMDSALRDFEIGQRALLERALKAEARNAEVVLTVKHVCDTLRQIRDLANVNAETRRMIVICGEMLNTAMKP